jgi:AraC family transcriptional regulator of adaptative response/methylated-DNA-[protein]-cysteine methyltransferase
MLGAMSESKRFGAVGRPATAAEWAAIQTRRGSGRPFLFVVASTGIICTPGCPARTPGRDRVRVVSGLDEGLAVGARACLRCHPDRLFGSNVAPAVDPVQTAIDRMTAALVDGDVVPTDRVLAGELQITERRMREMFRRSLGVTPRAWVSARRAELLRSRLASGQDVTTALYDAGYGSSSAAYEAANGEMGMAPGRYRTGAAGESIRWTVAPIPAGSGAGRNNGTRPVRRAARRTRPSRSQLRSCASEFPGAALARDDAALAEVAAIVSDLAAGRRRPEAADSTALDVHATAFRRRVWEALRCIPFGETRSYGQIAAAVGAPGAARAVGTACAAESGRGGRPLPPGGGL